MAEDRVTEAQPSPTLSTESRPDHDVGGTETQPAPNISTEHQEPGDARNPSDHLEEPQQQPADDGGRRSSLTDPDAT